MSDVTLINDPQPHAEAIRALYHRSLKDNPHGFIQDPAYHGDIIDQMNQMLDGGGTVKILLIDDFVRGFGALKKNEAGFELCKLHLDPDFHGQGLGKKLSQSLIETAREKGAPQVDLHVTVTQDKAIGLYTHLGFETTKQKIYTIAWQGETLRFDTVFMVLTLSPV